MPDQKAIRSETSMLLRRLAVRLADTVIATSMPCRGCGYDLKGLAGDRDCPECGLKVVETVVATVDPAASRLPALRDPAGVGNGLFWLVACGLAGTILLAAEPVAERFGVSWTHGPLVAALCFASGLWTIVKLKPPAGEEPRGAIRRDLWLVGACLTTATILSLVRWWQIRAGTLVPLTPIQLILLLVQCAAGIAGLMGIGGVLRTIGQRSRAYRSSHAARQNVMAMVAAVGGIAMGAAIRAGAEALGRPQWLSRGTVVLGVSALMVVIGLAYMLLNAWWIRSALRKPPPDLDDLLAETLPEE